MALTDIELMEIALRNTAHLMGNHYGHDAIAMFAEFLADELRRLRGNREDEREAEREREAWRQAIG